jgi:hypothetical protein
MKYRYEGFNKVGSIKRGTVEADNIGRAAEMLRNEGIFAQQLELDDGTQMRNVLGTTEPESPEPAFIEKPIAPAPLPETTIMDRPKFACSTVAGLSGRPVTTWQEDFEVCMSKIVEMYNYQPKLGKKKKDQIPAKIISEARDMAAKEAIAQAYLRALDMEF